MTVSPLELLHPDGLVAGVAVGGAAAPAPLVPQHGSPDRPLDLVLLGPSASELRAGAWLESALGALVPRLTPDGVVYVLVPRDRRREARRELLHSGLQVALAVAHVPDSESSRYLVPLERPLARTAFLDVVAVWPRRRRMLALLLRLPGATAALERLLPSVALVARKPGARPVFAWASAQVEGGADPRVGALVTSGRPPGDRVVLLLDGRPSVVAKVRSESSGLEQEAEALAGQGSRARTAGADVPEPIRLQPLGKRSVLFETGLAGESAAALLASRPRKLTSVLELLGDWLDRWHRATLVEQSWGREELEARVLVAAEVLSPYLEDAAGYVSWLRERCEAAVGEGVPVVDAHNDLTMFNVLVRDGRLGVVDWEEASERGLPLTDFFYAAVDAVAAAGGYANRLDAFQACFRQNGSPSDVVARIQRRLMRTTGMTAAMAEVAFHACWLQHAANEHRREDPESRPPFLSIVQRLAARPEGWTASRGT